MYMIEMKSDSLDWKSINDEVSDVTLTKPVVFSCNKYVEVPYCIIVVRLQVDYICSNPAKIIYIYIY